MNYEILSIETIKELARAKEKNKELERKMDLARISLVRLLSNQKIINKEITDQINKSIEFLAVEK